VYYKNFQKIITNQKMLSAKERILRGMDRMSKDMRSVYLGGRWITLKLDPLSPTGCNIYFDSDQRVHVMGKKYVLVEKDILFLADAVITAKVYPDFASQIIKG